MKKTKAKPKATGGPVPSKRERMEAGAIRVDIWIPAEDIASLNMLAAIEAAETARPAERCRTLAILRAIRERADAVRRVRVK